MYQYFYSDISWLANLENRKRNLPELAAEEEGGDHGLLHCFPQPGFLVLLTFSPWGCRERSEAFQEAAEIQQDTQEDLICNLYRPVQAYMVPDRRAYPLLPLQQEHNSRGVHNSCQEDRILPPAELQLCKPKLPPTTDGSTLADFHGPRSVLLFNLIGVSHTFLTNDNWSNQPEYAITETALRNLSPLNDSCERVLALLLW